MKQSQTPKQAFTKDCSLLECQAKYFLSIAIARSVCFPKAITVMDPNLSPFIHHRFDTVFVGGKQETSDLSSQHNNSSRILSFFRDRVSVVRLNSSNWSECHTRICRSFDCVRNVLDSPWTSSYLLKCNVGLISQVALILVD